MDDCTVQGVRRVPRRMHVAVFGANSEYPCCPLAEFALFHCCVCVQAFAYRTDWLRQLLLRCPHSSTRSMVVDVLLTCLATLKPLQDRRCGLPAVCLLASLIVGLI